MWRKLNNHLNSLQTYADLSPDIQARYEVNQWLRSHRRAIDPRAWSREFQRSTGASEALVLFVYRHFLKSTGIDFNRVRPSDRLVEDLKFPLVCWFDWAMSLCEDFITEFGIDISGYFDETQFSTLADLIVFLQQQLPS
jgi:hypothetical protein